MELVILQLPFLTRFRPRWSRWVLRLRMFRSSNGAGQCAGAERAWPSADQDVCLGLLGYLCCSDILALVIIKAHIKACPTLRRDYTLLTSIKSVGPQLGMHMLVVLRSHNFASAEQAAAFLGVVPFEKRSGTSVRSRPGCRKSVRLS